MRSLSLRKKTAQAFALIVGLAILVIPALPCQTLSSETLLLGTKAAGTSLPYFQYATEDKLTPNHLDNYCLTVGDLNADGVQDLVVSNELAFLRVYFLEFDTQGKLSIKSVVTVLPFVGGQCNDTSDRRYLTVKQWGLTKPLIYDIDLDGKNELIYLDAGASQNEVLLAIYKHQLVASNDTISKVNISTPLGTDLDLSKMLLSGKSAYADTCNSESVKNHIQFGIQIANVRGRAWPQDIVAWAQPGGNPRLRVFGFDTLANGSQLTKLFETNPMIWPPSQPLFQSEPGSKTLTTMPCASRSTTRAATTWVPSCPVHPARTLTSSDSSALRPCPRAAISSRCTPWTHRTT